MIAGRPVILVAGDPLAPEVRVEIEAAGVLVINIARRDPALVVRHLRHALTSPLPEPRPDSLIDPRPRASRLELPEPDREQAIMCRGCGEPAEVKAGAGPHAARAVCTCGAWRWVARRELEAAGIDIASLAPAAEASQLALEGGSL